MTKLRRLLIAFATLAGAFAAGVAAFGGGIPPIPSSPTFSEPSQIQATLNTFINMLNGNATAITGGAVPGVVSLGSYGTVSGATPQTLNTVRGVATFTGVTVAAVSTGNVVVNNSLVTAASTCMASIVADNSAAGSFPYIRSVVTGAGTITVAISNAAAATSTGASTFGVAFNCIN